MEDLQLQQAIAYGESKFPHKAEVVENGFVMKEEDQELEVFPFEASDSSKAWMSIFRNGEGVVHQSPGGGRIYGPRGAINWMRERLDREGIWIIPASTTFDSSKFVQAIAARHWQQADLFPQTKHDRSKFYLRATAYHLARGSFPPILYRFAVSEWLLSFSRSANGWFHYIPTAELERLGVYKKATFDAIFNTLESLVESTPDSVLSGRREPEFDL